MGTLYYWCPHNIFTLVTLGALEMVVIQNSPKCEIVPLKECPSLPLPSNDAAWADPLVPVGNFNKVFTYPLPSYEHHADTSHLHSDTLVDRIAAAAASRKVFHKLVRDEVYPISIQLEILLKVFGAKPTHSFICAPLCFQAILLSCSSALLWKVGHHTTSHCSKRLESAEMTMMQTEAIVCRHLLQGLFLTLCIKILPLKLN